jgi:predicted  nucleic acid-binding Zn-ribbon protein
MSVEKNELDGLKPMIDDIGEEKKKNRVLLIIILLLVIILIVAGYFIFKGKSDQRVDRSPKLRQMNKLVTKIRDMESNIQEKQNEIFRLMKEYKKKTGKNMPLANTLSLTEQEKEILKKKIYEEKNISIKSLLSDIIDKNNDISDLKVKIEKIEALLPMPHIVNRGESHYKIAIDYLINQKGIEKERALELIERAALLEPLLPDFKVWNFYSGDEYGTFVTQGNASISPNQIIRKTKKKLVDARDEAISERDNLSSDIETLETRRNELISQLDLLNNEKTGLIEKLNDLNKQNVEMQENINSIFFIVDLKKNLKKKEIIKSGFLKSYKLQDISNEKFDLSVDLRYNNAINISAKELNLTKITKIVLYPKFYKHKIDYKINIYKDGKKAFLVILSKNKFKNEKIVISVE